MAEEDLDALDEQLAALEASIVDTTAVTAGFVEEMKRAQQAFGETGRDAQNLSRGLSRGLRTAFDGLVFDGMRAKDF